MRILESLYEHWTEHQAEAPEVRQCWVKLDKAMLELQSESTMESLKQLIEVRLNTQASQKVLLQVWSCQWKLSTF